MMQAQADDQTFEQLIKEGKTIVKFYADWCGSCKLFAPKFKRLSQDSRFEGIQFLQVNAELNEAARKLAGVDHLPYFAIFEEGKLLAGKATSKEDQVLHLLQQLN